MPHSSPFRSTPFPVLMPAPRNATPFVELDQRLRELGYVEGQNFTLEFIPLSGQFDRYGEAMKELVRRKVDVIIALGHGDRPQGSDCGNRYVADCYGRDRL